MAHFGYKLGRYCHGKTGSISHLKYSKLLQMYKSLFNWLLCRQEVMLIFLAFWSSFLLEKVDTSNILSVHYDFEIDCNYINLKLQNLWPCVSNLHWLKKLTEIGLMDLPVTGLDVCCCFPFALLHLHLLESLPWASDTVLNLLHFPGQNLCRLHDV